MLENVLRELQDADMLCHYVKQGYNAPDHPHHSPDIIL